MARFLIQIGSKKAWPLSIGLWFEKYAIRKRISFGYGCNDNLGMPIDVNNLNTLFGIGYLWSHKHNSAIFKWYYNNNTSKIAILAYGYIDGERIIEPMCEIPRWFTYDFFIVKHPFNYSLTVYNSSNGMVMSEKIIPYTHKKTISYPIGLSLAGPAKNDLEIEMYNL